MSVTRLYKIPVDAVPEEVLHSRFADRMYFVKCCQVSNYGNSGLYKGEIGGVGECGKCMKDSL